jgi:hypothetical protein
MFVKITLKYIYLCVCVHLYAYEFTQFLVYYSGQTVNVTHVNQDVPKTLPCLRQGAFKTVTSWPF